MIYPKDFENKIGFKSVKDRLTDLCISEMGKEFVEKMEKGYKTNLSQGGTNISGGQKQRLSIARAIARNPEIYIFDDSFSALDYKTEKEILSKLNTYYNSKTFIFISQRISTLSNCHKIIVLDKGKIVDFGTHNELLKKSKLYKEIYNVQKEVIEYDI